MLYHPLCFRPPPGTHKELEQEKEEVWKAGRIRDNRGGGGLKIQSRLQEAPLPSRTTTSVSTDSVHSLHVPLFLSLLINLPNVLLQTAEVAGLTCLFIPSPAGTLLLLLLLATGGDFRLY